MVHKESCDALRVTALEAQGDEVDHLGLSVGNGHDGVVSPGRER